MVRIFFFFKKRACHPRYRMASLFLLSTNSSCLPINYYHLMRNFPGWAVGLGYDIIWLYYANLEIPYAHFWHVFCQKEPHLPLPLRVVGVQWRVEMLFFYIAASHLGENLDISSAQHRCRVSADDHIQLMVTSWTLHWHLVECHICSLPPPPCPFCIVYTLWLYICLHLAVFS